MFEDEIPNEVSDLNTEPSATTAEENTIEAQIQEEVAPTETTEEAIEEVNTPIDQTEATTTDI